MYGIFVNNQLIAIKDDESSGNFAFERLINYFKSLKINYINLGICIEEKIIELINLENNCAIKKETISDL